MPDLSPVPQIKPLLPVSGIEGKKFYNLPVHYSSHVLIVHQAFDIELHFASVGRELLL